jgi:endonuclease-3
MTESSKKKAERAVKIDAILAKLYPNVTALRHVDTLQLLVATILSAQCTDAQVNMVTPGLFEKYPDAKAFAEADVGELEQAIFSTGFYRQKTRSIRGCCKAIIEKHGGKVPKTLEEMIKLPGVGRKTGNLVLGIAEGLPGVVVDTHVKRLANRMGLTENKDPEKIEKDINALLPPERWMPFSSELIFLGREFCPARKPKCDRCPVAVLCPKIGVVA